MRFISPTFVLSVAILFGISEGAYSQECNNLRNADSPALVSFLAGIVPDEKNEQCVAWAIYQLGARRYEPGSDVLGRYLDFQHPLDANGKVITHIRTPSIEDAYPAVDALIRIGEKGLPTVLRAIEADSTSARALENAVFVWMQIHKYEAPKGVALLKQEADKSSDDKVKGRLQSAISKALNWCNPPDEAACKAAATGNSK